MLDRAPKFVDFVMLRISLRLELLGDAATLILGLLAANFELLGLASEPFFELLRATTTARELLGVVFHFRPSTAESLLFLGKFASGGLKLVLLARQRILLLTELLERQLMLTDFFRKSLFASIEFPLRGLNIGSQTVGSGS